MAIPDGTDITSDVKGKIRGLKGPSNRMRWSARLEYPRGQRITQRNVVPLKLDPTNRSTRAAVSSLSNFLVDTTLTSDATLRQLKRYAAMRPLYDQPLFGEWNMSDPVDLYNSAYGNFATDVLGQVRREAFGEDIGQNSWLTADEYLRFFEYLELKQASNVLEIACGSGGPALFMARTKGCHIIGIDNNKNGVATANKMSREQGLASLVRFQYSDASQPLPFQAEAFDSIVCIDAINHLHNRSRVLAEWHRVLQPEGRILFTDPITVTGLLSNEEIAIRSSIGYFLFAPVGEDERLIKEAGFELISCEDVTDNEEKISKKWHDARAKRRDDLIKIEGEKRFEGLQQFLSVVYKLSSERRLSRYVFVARKTDEG